MTEHSSSLAWQGNGDDNLAPGQFLREIDNKIDDRSYSTEAKKVKCLRNNIAYGSKADEWFDNLDPATETDTYDHLTDAFAKQWPLTAVPKASKAERIQALKDWVLKQTELGKKVEGPGGSQIWSHIKWATGLAAKVRDAEDSTGFLVSDIYNGLPRPVRSLIRKEKRATYEELTASVIAINVTELKEMVADFTRNEETARLARETPASPTKAIREALTATHLQTPQIRYNPQPPAPYTANAPAPAQVNPFVGQGGCGNLFGPIHGANLPSLRGVGPGALGIGRGAIRPNLTQGPSLRNRPIRLRYQDMNQSKLPHHPNTAAGHAAYQLQVTAWHTANPSSRPDEQHPYPLLPGGFAVGSRECWDCGLQGHLQGATVCQGALLPEPERDWRRIAGYITRMYNKEALLATASNRPQAVNHVSYAQYTPYPNYGRYGPYSDQGYAGEVEDDQGNGEGLSA